MLLRMSVADVLRNSFSGFLIPVFDFSRSYAFLIESLQMGLPSAVNARTTSGLPFELRRARLPSPDRNFLSSAKVVLQSR